MGGLFDGELGLMISALLVFAGMVDFMIITLFLSRQRPRLRGSDDTSLTVAEKVQIKQRLKRYQIMQFALAMSGFLLIVAGLYGVSVQVMRIL